MPRTKPQAPASAGQKTCFVTARCTVKGKPVWASSAASCRAGGIRALSLSRQKESKFFHRAEECKGVQAAISGFRVVVAAKELCLVLRSSKMVVSLKGKVPPNNGIEPTRLWREGHGALKANLVWACGAAKSNPAGGSCRGVRRQEHSLWVSQTHITL